MGGSTGFRLHHRSGDLSLVAAGSQGPWFPALDHGRGVVEAWPCPHRHARPRPGPAQLPGLSAPYGMLPRVHASRQPPPDVPLRQLMVRVGSLPRTTGAERLVVQRIGRDIFAPASWSTGKTCCGLPTFFPGSIAGRRILTKAVQGCRPRPSGRCWAVGCASFAETAGHFFGEWSPLFQATVQSWCRSCAAATGSTPIPIRKRRWQGHSAVPVSSGTMHWPSVKTSTAKG